jgi:hypothetical protein
MGGFDREKKGFKKIKNAEKNTQTKKGQRDFSVFSEISFGCRGFF